MSDVLAKAASATEDRLAEIDDEKKRLERALTSLVGGHRRPGRPRGSANAAKPKTRTRKSRKRAKRGEREAQLTASVKANPNYKPVDHAREIGVSANQVYGLIAKMMKAGAIKKSGDSTLAVVPAAG